MVKIDRQPVALLFVTYVLEQALFLGEKPSGKEKTSRNDNTKTVGWIQKAELVLLW